MRAIATVIALLSVLAASTVRAEEADPAEASAETRYVELKPTFVTNFGPTTTPRLMYIKTDVALRVFGSEGEKAAEHHLPALRNALVLLLSKQSESAVITGEAREYVREQALAELQEILVAEEGEALIEDLLFTNFIVQR
ncbi:MAG: flagellar basal body-associated FliL family protein [Pseudomonadota bacterium]